MIKTIIQLDHIGDNTALDFVNTVSWRLTDQPIDYLQTYADLVAWSQQAGSITPIQATELLAMARVYPDAAAEVLQQAQQVRETLYRLFHAIGTDLPIEQTDLDDFNVALHATQQHMIISRADDGFAWRWHDQPELDRMVWPIVWAAAQLLLSDECKRVGQCASATCGWLFVDRSRNQRRRWCSMSDCGNVAKVRRHRAARR